TKAGVEGYTIVIEQQILYCRRADIQHNLAVVHKLLRHLHALQAGIDQQVRRTLVIQNPLMQRPHQIRTTGGHGTAHQSRISRSRSDRLAWKASRSNRRSIYCSKGLHCFSGSSMPTTGKRHRIGAMQQSTIENSSFMKYGISTKIGVMAIRLSVSSLRAASASLPLPVRMVRIRSPQSFSTR